MITRGLSCSQLNEELVIELYLWLPPPPISVLKDGKSYSPMFINHHCYQQIRNSVPEFVIYTHLFRMR